MDILQPHRLGRATCVRVEHGDARVQALDQGAHQPVPVAILRADRDCGGEDGLGEGRHPDR